MMADELNNKVKDDKDELFLDTVPMKERNQKDLQITINREMNNDDLEGLEICLGMKDM